MSKRQFHLVLAIAIALAAGRARAELPFTHFTPEGGVVRLPSASVREIVVDPTGHGPGGVTRELHVADGLDLIRGDRFDDVQALVDGGE